METPPAPLLAVTLSLLLVTVGGCRQTHEGWEPPGEQTSTRLLQQEADAALRFSGPCLRGTTRATLP